MHLPVFCQHEKSGEFLLALAHPGTFATRGRWLRCVDRRSFLFVLLICLAELIELDMHLHYVRRVQRTEC